ncbi:MAG: protein kinase [Acidobacteria bacterium]|nr:protein kinase [Acidobacteriota bacterium]MCA1639593.1 protein kinase [Acidobacteriota bacterium]
MNSERWQKIKDLFDIAQEIPSAKREKFLDNACAGDTDLRREVENLLSSLENPTSFMEQPAAKEVASLIIERNSKLEDGQTLAHYRILSKIGAGGMGDVYLAKDTRLNRQVAIKLLSNELNKNENHLQRFIQEARAVSALNHPNIITVYEIGEFEDTHFIAAEYIEGETLRERLSRELTLNEVLDITTQMASALSAAHKAGIVHRDVKPENVMIRREDNLVKVLDFGLAKLTKQQAISDEDATLAQVKTNLGVIMGTVAYMSPEQARGRQVDERTDIWSFGAVLYEMLAERQPFAGETMSDAIAAILKNEPAPLGENTPPELNRIIRKTLQKNVDERYQTVKDLLLDLKNLKREVEFSEEIERSHTPSFAKSANVGATLLGENATAIQPAISTQNNISRQTSSAEYVISEVKRHKFVSLGVLAALVVALAAIGYFRFFAAHSAEINSIAVLPFVNESGNAEVEYLSDGMTETLINSLSQLPKLSVKARSSVFRYKGKETDAKQVGADLNVQAVLNGRVIQRGEQLILNLELVDAKTENVIWSEQYARKQGDLVSLQSEIARDVSNKLRAKLSGAEQQKLAKNSTENSEAYQLYLKGRYYWYKFPAKEYEKSRDYYQQAIDVDPTYALAYAGLAEYYGFGAALGVLPPNENWVKSEAAVNKALAIDDKLPDAYNALAGVTLYYHDDWARTEGELRRAIELNPNYAEARSHYAANLLDFGRSEEALAQMKKALELDPLSLRFNRNLAMAFHYLRQYDRAVEQYQKTLELDPNDAYTHELLGNTYEQKGMQKEAVAEWSKALRLTDDNEVATMLERNYTASDFNAAVRVLWQKKIEQLKEKARRGEYIPAMNFALAYTRLADKEQAFAWLAKAEKERNRLKYDVKLDPTYDSLRGDSRFQDLLRRVGLPQ